VNKYQDKRCKVVDEIINYLDDPKYRRNEHADETGSRDHQLHAEPEDTNPPEPTGPAYRMGSTEDWINELLAAIDALNARLKILERRCDNWIGQ